MRAYWTTPLIVLLMFLSVTPAWSAEGLLTLKSANNPKITMDRLQTIVTEKGMKVFARIDHSAGAAKVGKKLRPTELLIFGNPKGGTPFMQCAQTAGIDLPLKMLVWEDASGTVWVGYNDPAFLAKRHGVPACPVIPKMAKALGKFARYATQPEDEAAKP